MADPMDMMSARTPDVRSPKIAAHMPQAMYDTILDAAHEERISKSKWVRDACYERLRKEGRLDVG